MKVATPLKLASQTRTNLDNVVSVCYSETSKSDSDQNQDENVHLNVELNWAKDSQFPGLKLLSSTLLSPGCNPLSGVSLWRWNVLETKVSKYLLLRRSSQVFTLWEKKQRVTLIPSHNCHSFIYFRQNNTASIKCRVRNSFHLSLEQLGSVHQTISTCWFSEVCAVTTALSSVSV